MDSYTILFILTNFSTEQNKEHNKVREKDPVVNLVQLFVIKIDFLRSKNQI